MKKKSHVSLSIYSKCCFTVSYAFFSISGSVTQKTNDDEERRKFACRNTKNNFDYTSLWDIFITFFLLKNQTENVLFRVLGEKKKRKFVSSTNLRPLPFFERGGGGGQNWRGEIREKALESFGAPFPRNFYRIMIKSSGKAQ